ncbi:hypothetical protein RCL_jg1058.t1 [Rhizophagus clarus]|uniref:Uncharacterized protein n=1 Tax=Rhizophagus clarus TaxID=94130 RepID=A0A8H3MAP8_9GLOM|nr:hypothetical protein RCL_jg1058.t1 [Rhizophagus clarus]
MYLKQHVTITSIFIKINIERTKEHTTTGLTIKRSRFLNAEFINRDDVLAWSVDIPTNDKFEILPYVEMHNFHSSIKISSKI